MPKHILFSVYKLHIKLRSVSASNLMSLILKPSVVPLTANYMIACYSTIVSESLL